LITGTITDATTDARRIIEWWTSMPTANLATPAGLTFDVLDYTYPGPTAPLLAWLTASGLDPTPILTTGDGHLHFPVRNPNPPPPMPTTATASPTSTASTTAPRSCSPQAN